LKATGQQAAPAIGKPGLRGRLKAHSAVNRFVHAPNTVSAAMPGEIVACKGITIFKRITAECAPLPKTGTAATLKRSGAIRTNA